jgi:hypothetical protein
MEKHTFGCRPNRPLAVAAEERAEPPLHHRYGRDNCSDGGDRDHSQREPCGSCLPLLAHLRAACVINQPLLRIRAGVQPRAGKMGASRPLTGEHAVVFGMTSTARCATCLPPGIRPCLPTMFSLYPSLPQPELPPTVSVALIGLAERR